MGSQLGFWYSFLGCSDSLCLRSLKFRATGDETELPKQVTGNHLLEIPWTIIPDFYCSSPCRLWEIIFQQDRDQKQAAVSENVLKIDARSPVVVGSLSTRILVSQLLTN